MREAMGPRLPEGWTPPMPFKVRVAYWAPGREPDVLWTMPLPWVQSGAGPVTYAAFGPAGAPAAWSLIEAADLREMPENARVHVATTMDHYGRSVYAQAQHTLN